MSDSKNGRGIVLLVVGGVLLVIGLLTLIPFGWATPGENTAGTHLAWETILTIGSSILIGVGVLLAAWGLTRLIRFRASRRQGGDDDFDPTGQDIRL